MSFRFRRRISLGKGVNLNLSKGGMGLSLGRKGARLGMGPRGSYTSMGLPGTGLYALHYLGSKKKGAKEEPQQTSVRKGESLPIPASLQATGYPIFLIIASLLVLFFNIGWGLLLFSVSVLWLGLNGRSPRGQALTHVQKARRQWKRGDRETGAQSMARAHELYRQDQELQALTALLWMHLEKYEKAIPLLQELQGKNPQWDLQLILAYLKLGQPEKALQMVESFPRELQELVEILNLRAICFLDMGQGEMALEVLKTGPIRKRKLEGALKDFRYLMGQAYKETGQKAKAIKEFRRVYAADSTYGDVKKELENLTGETMS